MRAFLIPILAFGCMGASEEASLETLKPEPRLAVGYGISAFDRLLAANGTSVISGDEIKARQSYLRETCRDRIVQTKAEAVQSPPGPAASLPLLQRQPATPQKPQAIYAVDRREDGCGVMVMMGNPDDVRPVPLTNQDDYRLMPAETPEN
ncbi:MAG: hypothetical protein AAF251_01615 [Pseudomonadota bacterium]